MTVLKRNVLTTALFLMILVALLYGVLFLLFQSARFKLLVETELSARTGYEIGLGQIHFSPPFKITGRLVTVTKSAKTLLTSSQVTLTLNPLDLFSKTIHRLVLERPVAYLELEELLKAPPQTSSAVAVRHLNVRDGAVVLKTAEKNSIEFSSINLNAQNLNVGQTSGITLRADVPWLDAEAELFIKQQEEKKEVEMILRPRPADRLIGLPLPKKQAKETMRLQAKLSTARNAGPHLTLAGRFDKLVIGPKPLTGSLDADVIPNSDFTEAALSARIEVADFPNAVSPRMIEGPNGVAVATVTGNYSTAKKLLALTAFQIDSPAGTAQGAGHFSTGDGFPVDDARLTLRKVQWQTIKSFLPEPLNRWSYRGTGMADLNFHGPWRALQIAGTVSSDALQLQGADFALASIALHAPIVWKDSSLEMRNISLNGESLTFGAKDHLNTGAQQVQLEGSLTYKANTPLNVTARVQLAGGRFASADSAKMGENLAVGGTLDFISNRANDSIKLTGKLSLERGEILLGKFFVDVGAQRPALNFDADYFPNRETVQLHRADLTLASAGGFAVTGSINGLANV
ncbi:MAG: hypothetical protein ACREO5_03355, partial [Candidatus Binatia bacterium]